MEAVRRSKIKTHMRWVGRVVAAIFIAATPSLAQMREEKMLVGYGGVGGYQLPLWFSSLIPVPSTRWSVVGSFKNCPGEGGICNSRSSTRSKKATMPKRVVGFVHSTRS